MRKERLIEIAEWCEAGCPERNGVVGFNMQDYAKPTECGTVCCIAGAACYFFPGELFNGFHGHKKPAANRLGLTARQADELFTPDVECGYNNADDYLPYSEITPAMAARTLRHLAETGKVVWIF